MQEDHRMKFYLEPGQAKLTRGGGAGGGTQVWGRSGGHEGERGRS